MLSSNQTTLSDSHYLDWQLFGGTLFSNKITFAPLCHFVKLFDTLCTLRGSPVVCDHWRSCQLCLVINSVVCCSQFVQIFRLESQSPQRKQQCFKLIVSQSINKFPRQNWGTYIPTYRQWRRDHTVKQQVCVKVQFIKLIFHHSILYQGICIYIIEMVCQ